MILVPSAAAEQVVVVYLQDAPDGSWTVRREEEAPVTLTDPGIGVRTAELRGEARRFAHLRIDGTGGTLYDGTVVTTDTEREVIAFRYDRGELARVPVAPSARVELALDPRTSWWVTFGWGALGLGWLAVAGMAWARRR